jgi:hypothetical protein
MDNVIDLTKVTPMQRLASRFTHKLKREGITDANMAELNTMYHALLKEAKSQIPEVES